MKILSVTWSIYDNRLKQFCSDFTGGGLVIKNICEYIGRKEESYLFIGKYKVPEMRLGNIHLIGTSLEPDVENVQSNVNENHLQTMINAFLKALQKIKPNFVNVHGLGDFTRRCVEICIEKKIPYVYTEHLYIDINQKIIGYEKHIQYEHAIYKIPDLKIIAVSTGMKKNILKNFPDIPEDNIHVVLNGTDFTAKNVKSEYVEKYHLWDKKVLLCVGSIIARKNQLQLVDAYMKLPIDIRDNIKIIFCGKDCMQGKLQEKIALKELEDKLIYAGAVSSEEMKKYYSIADGLIMPSLAEGLSIAALEALTYGIPVILFSDSECADDLNDHRVVCFADGRNSENLADAIVDWYQKDWNKEYIVRYSKYFSMERMAEDYLNYYTEHLNI